ncbi:MAG: tetratricopeptide repeat protein [Candidatus Brocadiia bacterium]
MLVALRDIGFGEPIEVHGQAEDPNARLLPWPQEWLPAESIRGVRDLGDTEWVARERMVKHEPILRPRLIAKENFIPDDMYLQRVRVPEEDIKTGMLQAGMKVDVLEIIDNKPREFMRCVRVYAVGSRNRVGKPSASEGEVSPNVFLLLKKKHRLTFLDAQLAHEFRLLEAAGPCGDQPVLVEQESQEVIRTREAERMLAEAGEAMASGRHEDALSIMDKVTEQYEDLPKVVAKAAEARQECLQQMADQLLARARSAVEREEFQEALSLLEEIESDCPMAWSSDKVQKVYSAAQQGSDQKQRLAEFRDLSGQMQAALKVGNLPAAKQRLAEAGQVLEQGLNAAPNGTDPAQVYQTLGRQLEQAEADYRLNNRQVLESFLKRGEYDRAREKLRQIREEYPEHPANEELEAMVEQAESAGYAKPEETTTEANDA